MRNLLIALLVACTLVQGMTGQRLAGGLLGMHLSHARASTAARGVFVAVPALVWRACRLGGRYPHSSKRLLCFAGAFKPVPSFENDAEVQAAADFAADQVSPLPRHCSTPGRGSCHRARGYGTCEGRTHGALRRSERRDPS